MSTDATEPADVPDGLNERQARFCAEFVACGNATQAYRRCYQGESYNAARVSASQLLAKPNVQSRIAELRAERDERLGKTALDVMERLWENATLDPADLYEPDPDDPTGETVRPVPLHRLPAHIRRAIKLVRLRRRRLRASGPRGDTTQWEVEQMEYVPYDAAEALRDLADHHGLRRDSPALRRLLDLLSLRDGEGKPAGGDGEAK